jgi:hypothetical protein
MTLVVVVKCTDGLVLAADSRRTVYKLDDKAPATVKTEFVDGQPKLFYLREPQNYAGVLSFGYAAIKSGFIGDNRDAEMDRYSIGACIERFGDELQKRREPRKTVREFQIGLNNFLVTYWQRYRKKRRREADKTNQQKRQGEVSNGLEALLRMPPLNVHLLVAGYDEGEPAGRVFPIYLTDADDFWRGSRYVLTAQQIEMIRTPCGMFCGGLEDFVLPALTEDDPMESIAKTQHGSTEAIVAEIVDMKTRFGIRYVSEPNLLGFFSSCDLTAHDGEHLAYLLIRGTIDFFGAEGGVGGEIKICTVNPLAGIKCPSWAL